jgi:uncharacterized protein YkwD
MVLAVFGLGALMVDGTWRPVRAVTLCTLFALLPGCADGNRPSEQPSFYRSLAASDAQLDAASAASMFSGYRRNNSLGDVTLDPQLMALADTQARAMAARNKLDQNIGGGLNNRIKRSRYDAKVAVENIGAGYHTLAEAFSGWRDSPPHRANMLRSGVTKMGIAAVYAPGSKYKVFWALILAAPGDRRG